MAFSLWVLSMHADASPPTGFPYRRFASDARFALLLNVVFALLITSVVGRLSHFGVSLTFSMCIGTLAFVLIDGLRLWLLSRQIHLKWYAYGPVVLLLGAIAHYAGATLAHALLGLPRPEWSTLGYGGTENVIVVTLLISAVITLFFSHRERAYRAETAAAREKARAEAVERGALQTRLQLLQAQIEPHMLFNTLANVQGMIAIDPARAQHMLDQLIQYLRATLTSSRAEATTLGQEFDLLDAYLGLMSVRMGARLHYRLDLPPELRERAVPPMLLQPLVENAILHGLEPKIDGGRVTVQARAAAGELRLSVSDTGLGLDAPPARSGTRLGVANTRARLQALYGERAALALEANHPAGVIARLTLPESA
jgi:hypothetical protein